MVIFALIVHLVLMISIVWPYANFFYYYISSNNTDGTRALEMHSSFQTVA